MSDWPAKKNAAFTVTFPIYDADGDLVTAAASPDSEVSKDGGIFTDVSPGEASEIATASGVYTLALSATEMNADIVATITKTATGGAKTAVNVMYTVTRQLVDLAYPATSGRSIQVETDGMVHGDLKEWLGAAPNALVSSRVDASVGAVAANAIDAAGIADGAIDAATFAAGAINAAAIANGAIDAATFAAGAVDAAALATDAAEEIADAVWDELAAGHTDAGKAGQQVWTDVDAILADTDELQTDDYPTSIAAIQADTDNIQTRLPAALVTGRMDSDVGAIQAGAIDAAAIANGAIDAATFAAGAIDATAIATGAIDADSLAADAANEIADAVLERDIDQVEATMPIHSLGTAILKAVSRIVDDAGTLKLYRTNGSTLHMSQTITVNASADPIDELTVGV